MSNTLSGQPRETPLQRQESSPGKCSIHTPNYGQRESMSKQKSSAILNRRVFKSLNLLYSFTFPLSPVTRRYLEITDMQNSNEARNRTEAPIPAPSLSESMPSRPKAFIGPAIRPGNTRVATSHNRTLSDQPISSTPRAPLTHMRSVTAAHPREPTLPPSTSTQTQGGKDSGSAAPVVPSTPAKAGSQHTGTIRREGRRPAVAGGLSYASGMRVEVLRSASTRTMRSKPRPKEEDTLAALIAEEQRERERALEIPLPDSDSEEELPFDLPSRPILGSASAPQISRWGDSNTKITALVNEQGATPVETSSSQPVPSSSISYQQRTKTNPLGTSHPKMPNGHTSQREKIHQILTASQEREKNAENIASSSAGLVNGEDGGPDEVAGSFRPSAIDATEPTSQSTLVTVVKSEVPLRKPHLPPAQIISRAPGFKPRRGRDGAAVVQDQDGVSVQGSEQPRKVSAFGVPTVITIPSKSIPPVQPAAKRTTARSNVSTTSKARPPVDSTSVRSVSSSRPPSAQSGIRATSATGQRAAVGAKPKASAPVTASKPEAPKAEARSRNATGTTTSQIAKQKPPVRRAGTGFVPTSKLRGANTTAPGAQKSLRGENKAAAVPVEADIAARIPLPPTPDPGTASEGASDAATLVPLPTSPVLEAQSAAISSISEASLPPAEPVPTAALGTSAGINSSEGHIVLDNGFPTIESIKARLSDVLEEAKSMARHGSPALSTSSSVGDSSKTGFQNPLFEREVDTEFKLTDLDSLPQPPAIALITPNEHPSSEVNGVTYINGDQDPRRLDADSLTAATSLTHSFASAVESATEHPGPTKPSDAQKGLRAALTDKGINVDLE